MLCSLAMVSDQTTEWLGFKMGYAETRALLRIPTISPQIQAGYLTVLMGVSEHLVM